MDGALGTIYNLLINKNDSYYLPRNGTHPAIIIKNTALTTVSSGVMTEWDQTNDGRFWYGYTFQGTGLRIPNIRRRWSRGGGSEIRYVNFWEFEDYTPADIERRNRYRR